MYRSTTRVLFAVVLLVAVASATALGVTVADIVGQVSQSNYTDILVNQLYTHVGDNRSCLGGPDHEAAAANIFLSFRRDGLTTRYDPFTYTTGGTTYNCKNIIATKQGMTNPDSIYILGGHYDARSPGADDNGSGTAGVLEAARVLSHYDFDSTIIFCAFDCEEWGMWGSKHMAADYAGRPIAGMVNLDMISWNMPSKPNRVLLYGNSPTMKQGLGTAITTYSNGITWSDGGDWSATDHSSFEAYGAPAVWPYEAQKQGNSDIHTTRDNIDRTDGYIDFVYATNITRGVVGYMASTAGLIGPSASVPEPGSLATVAIGLACLLGSARRRRR